MEVVGLVAAVAQLIDVTTKTIKYINSVKDASPDRLRVGREASGLLQLLWDLRSQVDANKSDEWSRGVQSLDLEHGPIDQLREALEQLAKKLKPKKGLKGTLRAFVWTLDKAYAQEILGKIERVKSCIVLAMQGDLIKLAQAMKAETAFISRIDEGVSVITSNMDKLMTAEQLQRRKSILEWLSPLNFYKSQEDIFARWEEGTAGAGKSILASVVINFLRARYAEQESVGVAAIYCNFKERDSQSPENLLAGWSAQLVKQTLPDLLVNIHQMHSAQQTRPTRKEIIRLFEDIVTRLDTVYLVVDALDECSEGVRDFLLTFFETLPSNIRLLVTTRHIDEITRVFRTSPMLEIRASLGDLEKYVRSRVGSYRRLSGLVRSNDNLHKDIGHRVAFKAEGMFLAAKLHVDALSTKINIKQLKEALENLSTNINELYDDAISRIESEDQDYRTLAQKALRWIAYAYRPLRVEALQEAVAIELGQANFDDEATNSIGSILDVCAGLLIHDEETGIVRLVHYTAQDYFDVHAGSRFDNAHPCIARECITYLGYQCFQNPEYFRDSKSSDNSDAQNDERLEYRPSNAHVDKRSRSYYLFHYASAFWAQHATTRQDPDLSTELHHFLRGNPRIFLPTPWQFYLRAQPLNMSTAPKALNLHHGCEIAAFFGLHDELQTFCKETKTSEALSYLPQAAFHRAVNNGQIRSVEILLDYGVNINREDTHGDSALYNAIKAGNLTLVNFLLARGSEVETRGINGRSLLSWAAMSHKDCCLALLDHGAAIDSTDYAGDTALHYASGCGHTEVVKILLARGSDSDARNKQGETPLIMAAKANHEDCMLALVRHGADVNMQDGDGISVLHIAAAKGTLTSVVQLIEHSATTNIRSRALSSVKFLKSPERLPNISFAFDINDQISYFIMDCPTYELLQHLETTLQCWEGAEEVLVWGDGLTALDLAALRGDDEIVHFLKSLPASVAESVSVSSERYLLETLGAISIEEARQETARRMEEDTRERMAADLAHSMERTEWKQRNRERRRETSRVAAREAYLSNVEGILGRTRAIREHVGRIGAENPSGVERSRIRDI
ncbi:MAG: hypothetical protein Q9207_007196 [Kuettlingeria erythrocarpa]